MQAIKITTLAAMSLFAIVACAPSAPPAVDSAADQAALHAIDQLVSHAVYAGDVETIVAQYADDAVLMPPDASAATSRDAIRKYWQGTVASIKSGEYEALGDYKVGVSGNLGWASGTFKDTGADGETVATGKFLSVSRKVNGKWLYVRDIFNYDPPATPAATVK